MNLKEARAKLAEKFKLSTYSRGVFKVKKSYYWGFTKSGDELIPAVKAIFPDAEILQSGNHFHAFVGGAKSGSAQDSYWWLTFKVPSIEVKKPVAERPALMDQASKNWFKQPVTTQDMMAM
jgi:hypothetical protein